MRTTCFQRVVPCEDEARVGRQALRHDDQRALRSVRGRRVEEGARRNVARGHVEPLDEQLREEARVRGRAADPGRDDAADLARAEAERRLGARHAGAQQRGEGAHAGLEHAVPVAPARLLGGGCHQASPPSTSGPSLSIPRRASAARSAGASAASAAPPSTGRTRRAVAWCASRSSVVSSASEPCSAVAR